MSPIGHSLTGLSLYALLTRQAVTGKDIKVLIPVIILSNLPDLDFIPGLISGQLNIFHNLFTHSLFFALLISLLFIPFKAFCRNLRLSPLIVFLLLSLHLIIDSLCGPRLGFHPTYGVAFFYPVYTPWIKMPFALFYGIKHKDLSALASLYNLRTVFLELLIGMSLMFFINRRIKRKKQGQEIEP